MKTKIVIIEHDPADIELIQHELKNENVNYTSERMRTENEYEKSLHNFKPDSNLSNYTFPYFYGTIAFKLKKKLSNLTTKVNRVLKKSTLSTKTPTVVEKRLDSSLNRTYSITDETPKKKIEKASEIEKKWFSDLFFQAPSAMGIVKGPNHVYEIVNTLYLELIGKKDIIGKSVKEVRPEYVPNGHIEILDQVYKTGVSFSANEVLIKLDKENNGKIIDSYTNLLYQAHRDDDGNIDGVFFFANDVTEQVVLRKKIEESEKRHRFLFENNPMPIWIIDSDTFKFLDINKMAVLKYGYSREEFLSMNAIDIRPEEDKERFRQSKNSFKSNEPIYNRGIWNHLKKDGTIISVEIIGHEIIYEGSPALFILSNDITDRKKAEESLLHSESRLKEAQAIAHLGNWELNFETGIGLWSDETCRIYGLSPKDNKQPYASWLSFIHPDDMDNVIAIVNESQRTLSNYVLKNRILLKDGTIKHIHSECKFKFDQNGKPISLFGIAHDVTEIKLARLQLEQQNKELIFQNEEKENRANELIIANKELSFQNSEKEDRANELIIANKELAFQNSEKENRANELIIANTELAFQNSEKEDRANELIIANTELAFQNSEKEDRANELIIANTELAFQNSEKEDRANELIIANKELAFQNSEKEDRANELIIANKELADYKYTLDETLIVAITDQKGRIIYANDNFCNISKYSREELIGQDHRIVSSGYHPKAYIQKLWETITSGKIWKGELKNKAKDGTFYWVETTITPFLDEHGTPYQYVATRFDITDRKKAEDSLLQSESRLKEAQAIVHLGNWEVNFETGISLWSDESCRIYGLLPEDNKHSYSSWLSFIHPDDMDNVMTIVNESQRTSSNCVLKNRILLKDGTIKHIHSEFRFEFDQNGKPISLFGIAHDVTEIKLARLQLEQQNKELAFQNSEKEHRANELIIANNDLIKTNTELDRFVYSVSHDLRSPLTSILGLLSFIEGESQETDTLEHAEMIRKSINRLDEFIKNILSYSRNNRTGLQLVKISIQQTAIDIVESLQSMKESKGIHYQIDVKEQHPFYSDRLRFNTILGNLISNAIKYHKKDESGRYIKITGESDHEQLQLTIADNGIGIAAEHHAKIFDMFFRLSGNKDGSGIGLYIVKDIVGILQGTIEIQSEPGIGTSFTITLKNLKP